MGVLAGALDFLLIFPGGVARWIELKTLTGSISDVQAVFMRRVGALGCPTAVCRTLEPSRPRRRLGARDRRLAQGPPHRRRHGPHHPAGCADL
jgi:hypothetical protein